MAVIISACMILDSRVGKARLLFRGRQQAVDEFRCLERIIRQNPKRRTVRNKIIRIVTQTGPVMVKRNIGSYHRSCHGTRQDAIATGITHNL